MTPETPPTPNENTDPTEGDNGQSPADDTSPDEEQRANGNSEAARRRAQLREAEAERDALAARLERSDRLMIESHISGSRVALHNPADLWELGGHTAADFVNDAGEVDPAKVQTALEALLADRPYLGTNFGGDPIATALRRQEPSPKNHQGNGGDFGAAIKRAHQEALGHGA